MLGKQSLNLHEDFIKILFQSELINDVDRFGDAEMRDSVLFFKALGFEEVHAFDVSEYEGADIIFDLNNELPENLLEKFDVVFDGGVIEHVFDVVTAFFNICNLCKKGGIIFNVNPVYNYLYNTFLNISPEMFIEFYEANEFRIIDCALFTWLSNKRDYSNWDERDVAWSRDLRLMNLIHPLKIGEYVRSLNLMSENPHPHTFIVAKKTKNSLQYVKPIVSGYAKKHKKHFNIA